MQQSASTLTVSKTSKETWPRRSLSRQMTWRSFERKVGNLEKLGEIWRLIKKLEARKRSQWAKVTDQSWAQNLSCRTVSESGEGVIFSFLESNLFCCENSLWVPLKVQMSAMPGGGGGLIKCCRSSHLRRRRRRSRRGGSLNVGEAHIGLKLNWKQHKFGKMGKFLLTNDKKFEIAGSLPK